MGTVLPWLLCLSLCVFLKTGFAVEHVDHGSASPKLAQTSKHYKDGVHNVEYDHEAVLGSRKQADEFDQLTPDESKKRLRVLAQKMDTNGDQLIELKELSAWIEQNLRKLDQEEVHERFDDVDENGDRKVTWEEYRKDAFGEDVLSDDQLEDQDELKLLKEDKRYWAAADLDGDGKLTVEEFAAFQNPEMHERMFDALFATTLEEKDKNKDGLIDLGEFLGEHGKDGEWVATEKERFGEYDKNKDGVLDKEEIRLWLVPSVAQTADEEARHLLDSSDANKDEKLSIEEIVNNYQLFVGSEATAYGEQLENLRHDEL